MLVSDDVIHIACAADAKYLPHAAAMLVSVLRRHPNTQVHFLHGEELPQAELAPLVEMVEGLGGVWHSHYIPAEWVAGLPRMQRIPAIMWYRVYLAEILPDVDRILYMDCDTLLMDDLTSLWRTDLSSAYLGAVNNVLDNDMNSWPQELGLPADQHYFNSGVLLLNLQAMRADDMSRRIITYGREKADQLKWPDQDALNYLLGHRRVELDPRWNCQNSLYYYPHSRNFFDKKKLVAAIQQPGIVHFEGGQIVKPWHYLSKHPSRKYYFACRSQTPWPDVSITGKTPFNCLLRLLPTKAAIAILLTVYKVRRRLSGWLS